MTEEDRWDLVGIKLRLNPHWASHGPIGEYLDILAKRNPCLEAWERWAKQKEEDDVAKQQSNSR